MAAHLLGVLAFLALASLAVVLADARPGAFPALASLAVVLADARPGAFLAHVSPFVVLAEACPGALLAPGALAVVRTFFLSLATFLAAPSYAAVLADA